LELNENNDIIQLIALHDRAILGSGNHPRIGDQIITQATKAKLDAPEALILDIATRHFFVETLDTRNRDRLDFHEVAVWAMRAALNEDDAAGFAATAKR